MHRRQCLTIVAGVGSTALAGCSGLGGGADTSSPEAVVESFYTITDGFDENTSTDDVLDSLDPIFHSASPVIDIIEATEDEDGGEGATEPTNLGSVETEVAEENLGVDELNEYGLGLLDISDENIESIAEENALVDTTVEYEDAETEETEFLTATESGEWLMVF